MAPIEQLAVSSTPHSGAARPLTIRRRPGWRAIDLRELWAYRELLLILATRDIRVRYKQTILGATWAIIQPLFSTIIFTIFFARLGGLSTANKRPEVFYFCGLIPWQLFSGALMNVSNSLVANQNLITKVYFPRMVIPTSSAMVGVLDFAISLGVLFVLMAVFHVPPSFRLLGIPLFGLLAFFGALGVGLWLSALNVEFRDVRYIIPFLVQFWFFVTPVIYPAELVQSPIKRLLLGLNPMSGVVEGFRWCVLGGPRPGAMLGVSLATIVLLLVSGAFYFRRMEKQFADIV